MLRPTATAVTPLDDPAYFRRVRANGYTVEWADGQDICPDELYYNSKAVTKKLIKASRRT